MYSTGGMFQYREQLAQEIGVEAESEISQRAGFAAAQQLVESLMRTAVIPADEIGFQQIVNLFTQWGYGSFTITELRLEERYAKIVAPDSIEGWVFREKAARHGAVCDYARGFLGGIMHGINEINGNDGDDFDDESNQIVCVESGCIAAGDDECTFVIGISSELLSQGLQPTSLVHTSIKETLTRLNRQLEHILDHSRKDHLTNLYNRSFFEAQLRQRIGFAKRRSDVVSLASIDVDHFKQVNDTLGHAVGDRVLRQLAYILENQAREGDIVARVGGDEFVWLMPATPPESAALVARRISGYMTTLQDEIGIPLTVSVGVAGYPHHASSPNELCEIADKAMYAAKSKGRNQVMLAGELNNLTAAPIFKQSPIDRPTPLKNESRSTDNSRQPISDILATPIGDIPANNSTAQLIDHAQPAISSTDHAPAKQPTGSLRTKRRRFTSHDVHGRD